MNPARRALSAAALAILALASGCARPLRPAQAASGTRAWSGRISVQVDSEPPQAFSAGFDLTGDAGSGELNLYTPLGSTVARLQWQPGQATLRDSSDRVRSYESLDALAAGALGTTVPVAALFQWLAGDDASVPGWQADLGQLSAGRITARRLGTQGPTAQLRLVLDR